MPNEVMPPFDEESPFIPTRENTEDEALNFFNTPASTAGGSHDTTRRRISTEFSSTPASREQRQYQQQRRQAQFGHKARPRIGQHRQYPRPGPAQLPHQIECLISSNTAADDKKDGPALHRFRLAEPRA